MSYPGMMICRKCGITYDTELKRFPQRCECDRGDEKKWSHGDYNEYQRLCMCCMSEVLRSGSKWSVWFCGVCKARIITLNKAAGTCVIPIGRHSLMNGLFANKETAASLEKQVQFANDLGTFFGRVNDLNEWKTIRLRTNLGLTKLAWKGDGKLDEYLRTLKKLDLRSLKQDSFLQLAEFFGVTNAASFLHPPTKTEE
jgi:hypothetical protein